MKSNLIKDPRITRLTYYGPYDYAYLISAMRSHFQQDNRLPKSESDFQKLVAEYFPTSFDARLLVRHNNTGNTFPKHTMMRLEDVSFEFYNSQF